MPGAFQYRQFTQLSDQNVVDSGWLKLLESAANRRFYHHPDWFSAIEQHLSVQPLTLSVVDKHNTPVALIVWQDSGTARRRTLPKHDHLSLADIIVDAGLSTRDINEVINCAINSQELQAWDYQFTHVPDHSVLRLATRSLAGWHHRQSRASAWFDLRKRVVPPSGKLKRNLKRLQRKLTDHGEVSTRWVSEGHQLADAFDQFTRLEASGWKAQGQSTAIQHDPALLGFYQRLLNPRWPGLQPIISLLWLDDRCIAAQYALQTDSTLSILKIAYDEDYAHYSPGSLLLQHMIGAARDHGLDTLSLVTSPVWAERWHPETEPVWHVTRYANNTGGRLLSMMDYLKQSARKRLRSTS